ncbi:reverse transcriptase [Corchorus capsularis]|uniref:Reverse transcriptase n=1 Tax=Corchorus capsularis TaxID=210143 RepID=A0A1R3GIN3_COCAP|nr:reverse transcriptase [Corchorus capsularis]
MSRLSLQGDAGNAVVVNDHDWLGDSDGDLSWFHLIGRLFSKRKANAEEVVFDQCQYWVRIFDMPILMMNTRIGVSIGELMGPVLEVDDTCGRFLRIRVVLTLVDALRKNTTVSTSQGELTVRFKYEKLPAFCRVCGILTHLDNDCLVGVTILRTQGYIEKQYDDSIRAELPDVKPRQSGFLARSRQGLPNQGVGFRLGTRQRMGVTKSGTIQPRGFRSHVDSQILRQRAAVARGVDRVEGGIVRSKEGLPVHKIRKKEVVPNPTLNTGMRDTLVTGEEPGIQDNNQPEFFPSQQREFAQTGDDFIPLQDDSISPTFVFGATSPPQGRRHRKWKKTARSTYSYSFDVLGPCSNHKIGQKRTKGVPNYDFFNIGNQKRAKEQDKGSANHEEDEFGEAIYRDLEPNLSKANNSDASDGQNVGQNFNSAGMEDTPSLPGTLTILNWNCRGLGGRRTVHVLRELVHCNNFPVLFLLETKCNKYEMEWLRVCLGYDSYFTVESVGRAGGLPLLWQNSSFVSILSFSLSHIDAMIDANSDERWRYTGFYGSPVVTRRHESWALLKLLSTKFQLPWICSGDFNEILSTDEKIGGQLRSQRQMQGFRDAVEFCIEDVISSSWNRGEGLDLKHRIPCCGQDLQCWDREVFGCVHTNIIKKRKELEALYSEYQSSSDSSPFYAALDELNELYDREESMWCQRAKDSNGTLQQDSTIVKRTIFKYYRELFTSNSPSVSDIHQVLALVNSRVTVEMNDLLMREFTSEEVRVAAFGMAPNKASGPDGMSPLFYQKYWHIVGEKVSEMALLFLNHGVALLEINHTNIVLIPKIDNPCQVKDYRPISLYNVVFKIVSKTLTNRLKEILPNIIGPYQSAFVPGRMIFDSSMIAFETVHYMKNKRRGIEKHMALKLDLSKAYDRVEWKFLEGIMRQLGFADRWISLVMHCVETVSYSVLVNGEETDKIAPTRGIRQGDPLSPYLFLLCMEGFSCLLQDAERLGHIRGVVVSRVAPRVSHLFFADDNLLFSRASLADCDAILDVLRQFELASGQQINTDKSAILFSKNTLEDLRSMIMNYLGVQRILDRDKYLGMPILIGRAKRIELEVIRDRLIKRVQGWQGKLLSIAGKAVLIQAVAQAIPTYLMSCFKFPKTFLHELNMVMARFWWGDTKLKWRIHWKSWDDLCISKLDGGLGFRDFEAFNLALLAKQCWRLLYNEDSLCFRVFRAKYFRGGSFMNATLGHNPSFVWRSLLAEGQWDVDLLQELFVQEDVDRILSIPLYQRPLRDTLIWNNAYNGQYSVRSGYFIARFLLGGLPFLLRIDLLNGVSFWGALVLPKVKFFLWRLVSNILPSKSQLQVRGVQIDSVCDVCGNDESSVYHIFFDCPFSYRVWGQSCPWIQGYLSEWSSRDDFWLLLLEKASQLGSLELVASLLWLIWNNRNKALYDGVCKCPSVVCVLAVNLVSDFEAANRRLERLQCSHVEQPWRPPSPGTFKLNSDAAYCCRRKEAGLGVVIRDSTGQVLYTAVTRVAWVLDSLFAEVYAILFGLLVAKTFGLGHVDAESDSLQAILELNRLTPSLWEGGSLIQQIKDLGSCFDSCSFRHVKRSANKFAHNLAHLECDVGENFVWCGVPLHVCNPNL